MSFSSQWLELREPIDHSARSKEIILELEKLFSGKSGIRVTDIGCGTGSTIRALEGAIKPEIYWHLIDNDAHLLEIASSYTSNSNVKTQEADLSLSLEAIFDRKPDIVTTSAFLDLVSEQWLEQFVDTITKNRVPFYAALTYDGRAGCNPALLDDAFILDKFNTHQKSDKGFGPALGPDAAERATKLFFDAGYQVHFDTSDWLGTPEHKDFQKMLLDGWAQAAKEIQPDATIKIDEWLAERNRLITQKDATVFIGHKDFLAVPKH